MGGDSGGFGYEGPGDEDEPYTITVIADKLKEAAALTKSFSVKAMNIFLATMGGAVLATGWTINMPVVIGMELFIAAKSPGGGIMIPEIIDVLDDTTDAIHSAWRDPPRWDYASMDRPGPDPYRKSAQRPALFDGQRSLERLVDLSRQSVFYIEKMMGAELAGDSEWAAYHRAHALHLLQRQEEILAMLPPPDPAVVLASIERHEHIDPAIGAQVRAIGRARGVLPAGA